MAVDVDRLVSAQSDANKQLEDILQQLHDKYVDIMESLRKEYIKAVEEIMKAANSSSVTQLPNDGGTFY